MRGEVGEVVAGEFFESHGEVFRAALHGFGIVVGLEFVFAREYVEADRDEAGDGLEEDEEDDEADMDRDEIDMEGVEESAGKGGVRGGDQSEEEKDEGGLHNGEDHALDDVFFLKVANFVCEDPD